MKIALFTALLTLSVVSSAKADDASSDASNPQGYVCQDSWINCMPMIADGSPASKYCSQDYLDWAKNNCATQPMIAE